MDLFRSTIKPVENVLKDGEMKKEDIAEIVLVGGSTRIPKVQQLVREFFSGRVCEFVHNCCILRVKNYTELSCILRVCYLVMYIVFILF